MLPAGIPVGATVHYILHRAKSKKQKAKAAAIYKGHRVKYAWGSIRGQWMCAAGFFCSAACVIENVHPL
jgi:hypothetical protein